MGGYVVRLARRIPNAVLCASILVTALVGLSTAASGSSDLRIFRATKDDAEYARDLARYDRASFALHPEEVTLVMYVERQPTLTIGLAEIKSVTVEKERYHKDKSLEDAVLEALREKPKDTSDEGAVIYYVATFTFSANAGSRIAKLPHEDSFELRLGSNSLSIGHFDRPIATKAVPILTVNLLDNDPQRIRAILAPLKGRVTWK